MKVTIYDNYHAGVACMERAEQDAFYGAVIRYAFEGEEPCFEGIAAAVWATIKPLIDKSLEGQINGSKGGNGRGNTNPIKPPSKTPLENHPIKPLQKRGVENQIKENKRNRKENSKSFFSNSYEKKDDAEAVKTASSFSGVPHCPLCGEKLDRTGMGDPDFWWCEACRDSFPEAKAKFEEVA